jgi:hypothetical protein
MSRRARTNINSELFVLSEESQHDSTSNNSTEDDVIIIKGDISTLGSEDVVQVIDNGETLSVKNKAGTYQFNRKVLKTNLTELKKESSTLVRALSSQHMESFRSVVEALRMLYGSQPSYDQVIKDIKAVFSDVKDVKPETVAAFFMGCFTDEKFPGPAGCSPKCTASLPPAEGTPGYASCEDLVLIYSADSTFSSLNEKRSQHAYIYVDHPDFKGFSDHDVKQLKGAGIEKASLIFGNEDGSYREITGVNLVDQLPRNAVTVKQASNASSAGGAIAFSIIVIAFILVLLIVLIRTKRLP